MQRIALVGFVFSSCCKMQDADGATLFFPSGRFDTKLSIQIQEWNDEPAPVERDALIAMKKTDYYEFLQISPNAEEETIHRVYRFLAARFHPDNPDSGNAEKFSTLTRAYEILSDPERRAEYDKARKRTPPQAIPLSQSIDFMDQLEGELNRRLAVLAVLYFKRRSTPHAPEVPLAEIELRMGFPRDYLDFTTWYLQKKGYITKADNSDFTLTALGVDFVETQRVNIPILNKLLTTGSHSSSEDDSAHMIEGPHAPLRPGPGVPNWTRETDRRAEAGERRAHPVERRVGRPDTRVNPIERRMNYTDRRRNPEDRRSKDEKRDSR